MRKKNIIMLVSVAVFLFVAATFFISYGFVSSKVINRNSTNNTFLNQVIKVEYSDGSEVLTTKQGNEFIPGSVIEKTFTIKNLSNRDVSYAIRLDEVVNEFNRKNDLVYELYLRDDLLSKDIFPSENNIIAYNLFLKKDESQTFKLKINYLKSIENQIIDSGKTFSASLSFEERQSSLSNLLIYGNTIHEDIPSISNPVDIKGVGDLVEDATSEFYSKYKVTLNYNNGSNYDIYLENPLRCIENTCDYIDFNRMSVVRKIGVLNLKDIANAELIENKIIANLSNLNVLPNSTTLCNYSTIDNIKVENNSLVLTNLNTYWNINNIDSFNNFKENNNVLVYYILNSGVTETIEVPNIALVDSGSDVSINTMVESSNIKLEYK